MPFLTEKKNQLAKQDKSRKGDIDQKILPLLEAINTHAKYYTTSSCSGRVLLWKGSGKKNEVEWIKVSHEAVVSGFFELPEEKKRGVVWLRLEPMILHIACRNLESANELLDISKPFYKKSCLLSIKNKIIVEIRGSEFMEMPLYKDNKPLFSEEERPWLKDFLNEKMKKVWGKMEEFRKKINF